MADAAPGSPPYSPKSTRDITDEQTILQVRQFMDEWHFRIIDTSLGDSWHRAKVIQAVIDIFELNGIPFTPEEREAFPNLEEESFILRLVDRMPQDFRVNFEKFVTQLETVVLTVAKVRTALEEKKTDVVEQALEDSDGLAQQMMKQAVVQASREVADIKRCSRSWVTNSQKRIERLEAAAELAVHAQQQLLAVETQLESYTGESKDKAKGVLMGLASAKTEALIHSVFSSWLGLVLKHKAEQAIHDKYEAIAKEAEDKLIHFQERHLSNVKGVLLRKADGADEHLLHICVTCWKDEMAMNKEEGGTAAEMRAMQERLKGIQDAQSANAHKTMTRLAAGNDQTLLELCTQAWVTFHNDYQKDKELEDQIKKTELALKEHMEKKKDEAKQVLDRMSAGSDAGLIALAMKHWIQLIDEAKKSAALEEQLNSAQGKFNSLKCRQGGNAMNVQNRVNEQLKAHLLLRCLHAWIQETKVNGVERKYSNKMEAKRRQLNSVQSLFKSFAQQLEQGLGNVEADSSGRTRVSRKSSHAGGEKMRSGREVSLPEIQSRQIPAA